MYEYIVEGDTLGGPSHFDYKYIPEAGKKTTYEEDNKRPEQSKAAFSIETVYLYAFVFGCLALALTGFSSIKVSMVATKSLVAVLS